MKHWMQWTLCLAAIMAVVAGCRTRPTSLAPGPDAPTWTYTGFEEGMRENGALLGMGIAEHAKIPDKNLQRVAAVSRARNEIASELRVMVESVVKDYTEAAFTENLGQGEVQTLVENVQKTIVDETLIGSKVHDVWINPANGDYYVLMTMSADDIAARLRQEIVDAERGRLRLDAERAHQELDRIIQEHRERRR